MSTLRTTLLFALATLPVAVFAQTDIGYGSQPTSASGNGSFVPLTNIPGLTNGLATAPSLPIFLNSLYVICIGIAAVLAVLQFVRAGVIYMGGDSVTEKKDAKDLMRLSVFGLILVLSPFIVFSIINPKILNLSLDVSGVQSTGAAGTTEAPSVASCQEKYTNITAIASNKVCNAEGHYVSIPKTCCQDNKDSATCCGIPK
jgi:hypothetical protein